MNGYALCVVVIILASIITTGVIGWPAGQLFTTQIIKELAQYDGRLTGTFGNYGAYEYLMKKIKTLTKLRELPWAPGFTHEFASEGVRHRNIVFQIDGLTLNTVLIMAHYDHIGPGFPGCNDNASGVFGLLKIAEHLSMASVPLPTIIFALTDCEEYGQVGSAAISEILRPNIVINLDTIGGYPVGSPIFVANDGNFSGHFDKVAREKRVNVKLVGIMPGRSDITNFLESAQCVEFGYPLGKLHTPSDTYENLNLDNMNLIIDLAIGLVNHVAYTTLVWTNRSTTR